jgi:hypothetical protein
MDVTSRVRQVEGDGFLLLGQGACDHSTTRKSLPWYPRGAKSYLHRSPILEKSATQDPPCHFPWARGGRRFPARSRASFQKHRQRQMLPISYAGSENGRKWLSDPMKRPKCSGS